MKTMQTDFIEEIFSITADYDSDLKGLYGESNEEVINLLKTLYPTLFKAYELLGGKTNEMY